MKLAGMTDYERREKQAHDKRTARRILFAFAIVISCVIYLALGLGCSAVATVTPDRVISREASFDGNEQNSGVVASTPTGFVVTAHFRERYNALIAVYGGDFAPALKPDEGIAPMGDRRWLIDKQHMVQFLTMNAWRKAGLAPKGGPR